MGAECGCVVLDQPPRVQPQPVCRITGPHVFVLLRLVFTTQPRGCQVAPSGHNRAKALACLRLLRNNDGIMSYEILDSFGGLFTGRILGTLSNAAFAKKQVRAAERSRATEQLRGPIQLENRQRA